MKKLQPPDKSHALLPSNLPLKIEIMSSPPLFRKFDRRLKPPPPSRKGGGGWGVDAHYVMVVGFCSIGD